MSGNQITTPPNPVPPSTPSKSYKELAIWSVICAIWIAGVGIILGVMALMFMRASNNFSGKSAAWAGIIVGSISTAGYALALCTSVNGPTLGEFVGGAITTCVPLYFVLQTWLGCAWSGRWRLAALLPMIGFVPALYYTLAGLAHGSNLWPLPLILFAPVGFVYLLACRVSRAFLDARTAS